MADRAPRCGLGVKRTAKIPYMKLCGRCGSYKPLGFFFNNRNAMFGKESICKPCKKSSINKWRIKNSEKHKECKRKHRERYKDRYRKYCRDWTRLNHKYALESAKLWRENNRGKVREANRRHKCKRKRAIPKWFNKKEVQYIYDLAKEKGLVVDHIVPISSEHVCGLHCGDNLRCIPASLNFHKGNRYWPDMWEGV